MNVGAESGQRGLGKSGLRVQMKSLCVPTEPIWCHPWASVGGLEWGKGAVTLDLP